MAGLGTLKMFDPELCILSGYATPQIVRVRIRHPHKLPEVVLASTEATMKPASCTYLTCSPCGRSRPSLIVIFATASGPGR